MGSGSRGPGAAVLVVLGASAAVALAAGDGGLLVRPLVLDDGTVRAVRLGGLAIGVLGLVALAIQGRRLRETRERGAGPTLGALLAAAAIMAVIALVAPRPVLPPLLDLPRPGFGAAIDEDAPADAPSPPTRGRPETTRGAVFEDGGDEGDVPLVPPRPDPPGAGSAEGPAGVGDILGPFLLLLLLLVALGAWALARRLRGPAAAPVPVEPGVAPEAAEAGLRASLADLDAGEGGPRRSITVAYLRLLGALDAAGAPRRPEEAPHEHLHRALAPLGVRPGPMHRLAGLYVAAQFRAHPVTEAHREEAAEALAAALADLEAGSAAPAGPGTSQEAAR